MLISFFNPSDLIGCGGDITNQIHSDTRRGYMEGYEEGIRRGGTWRGTQRGYMAGGMAGCTEGCTEVVAPSNHRFNG